MGETGFSRVVLPNGLTILVQKKEHGTISFGIGARFGAAHDPACHLIEHIPYTGTKTRTEEEVRGILSEWGGEHDAYVGFFSTFFVTKNLARRGYEPLRILCDVIKNPAFLEKKINNQRSVTIQEHRKRSSEPETILMDRIYRNVYCDTPLERAVVDDERVLRGTPRADLIERYQKWYIPSQLIIVAVGPVSAHRVVEIVKEYFPECEKKTVESTEVIPSAMEPTSGKIIIPTRGGSQLYMMVGFRTVPRNHPDFYPLRVFSMIVGESNNSRFFRKTRGDEGLVYNITSHFDTVRSSRQSVLRADCTLYHGMLRIYSNFETRNIRRVERIIKTELRELAENPVSEEELRHGKEGVIGKHLKAIEGTHQHMRMLFAAEANNSIEEFFTFEERIQAVTAEDVRRVARTYCKPNQGVWAMLKPGNGNN